MEEDKSKMPKWFGMPINPTGAIFLYSISIFLLLVLIVTLPPIFIIIWLLLMMTSYSPLMVLYVSLVFSVSFLLLFIFITILVYTISIAKKAR